MGKITSITIAIAVMAISFGFNNVKAGAQLTAPEKAITIEGKKPVKFKHDVHLDLGVTCGECHHDEKHNPRTAETIGAMDSPDGLKCVSCHNSDFGIKELQKKKTIFHKNCKECHKKGVGDKKGPTKCSGCHTKKKAVEGC